MAKTKSDRGLTRTVTLINPDDGNDYTFGPGDDLPAWAAKVITNPAAFESEDDYTEETRDGLVFVGARRDAEHNARGRTRPAVPRNGPGEKAVPESADAATADGSSGGSGAKSSK